MYRSGRRAARVRAAAAVTVCAALGMAGCSSAKPSWKSDATTAPPGLASYYSQQLDWSGCGDDPAFSTGVKAVDTMNDLASLECAWLTVPMDYDDPTGDTIRLAVARHTVEGSKGLVVVNPGGPGGSGVDFVNQLVDGAGDKLRGSLDVVGFDPRGVGRSAPVHCLDTDGLDTFLSTDFDTSTDTGLAQAEAAYAAFGAACQENTGPLLGHVDTISAARDMDVLRAALRQPTLTYLGISYGTKLGATYASLFPDRVGRMVLDGALDPTTPDSEQTVTQVAGFESAMRAYVTDCLAGGSSATKDTSGLGIGNVACPLSGSVDEAMAQVASVVTQAQATPMTTSSGRPLTGSLAFTGIIMPLYNQDYWILLTAALQAAIVQHNGTVLLFLADNYSDRCDGITCPVKDGFYSNIMEANTAINCADDRLDIDPQTLAEQIRQAAPILGGLSTDDADSCKDWPTPVVGPLPSYEAKGAPPIVVVGTTNDPATPYAWAQSLAKTLDSGVLVTHEGEGHAAYTGGIPCIQTAVDDYLVDGKVPQDGLTCSS